MQETLQRLFSIQFGTTNVSLLAAATAFVVFVALWFVTGSVGRALEQVIRRGSSRPHAGRAAMRWLTYALRLLALLVALQVGGINLTGIFAAGAVLAVGVGLAMQKIVENFVSGVILLLERSIQIGDVVEVEGQLVRVEHMGIRATIARTLNEEQIIVPNGMLVQNAIKNLTLEDPLHRVRIEVGVPHDTDIAALRDALTTAGRAVSNRSATEEPSVYLVNMSPSALEYELSVWTNDPWNKRRTQSEMRERAFAAMRERNISVALPQIDVHLQRSESGQGSESGQRSENGQHSAQDGELS